MWADLHAGERPGQAPGEGLLSLAESGQIVGRGPPPVALELTCVGPCEEKRWVLLAASGQRCRQWYRFGFMEPPDPRSVITGKTFGSFCSVKTFKAWDAENHFWSLFVYLHFTKLFTKWIT